MKSPFSYRWQEASPKGVPGQVPEKPRGGAGCSSCNWRAALDRFFLIKLPWLAVGCSVAGRDVKALLRRIFTNNLHHQPGRPPTPSPVLSGLLSHFFYRPFPVLTTRIIFLRLSPSLSAPCTQKSHGSHDCFRPRGDHCNSAGQFIAVGPHLQLGL